MTNEEIIKAQDQELRRLRIKNLQMKLHMQVLVSHPDIPTSDDIREKYTGEASFYDTILYYN